MWKKIIDSNPKNGDLILVCCSILFNENNICMGRYRKNSRSRYPDRIQVNGGFGHYSTYLSIDSVHWWLSIEDVLKCLNNRENGR